MSSPCDNCRCHERRRTTTRRSRVSACRDFLFNFTRHARERSTPAPDLFTDHPPGLDQMPTEMIPVLSTLEYWQSTSLHLVNNHLTSVHHASAWYLGRFIYLQENRTSINGSLHSPFDKYRGTPKHLVLASQLPLDYSRMFTLVLRGAPWLYMRVISKVRFGYSTIMGMFV